MTGKPYIARMTTSELNAMMVGGFATISGGLLAAYVGMGISPGHLVTASVISAPAALLIAKIMQPETGEPETLGTVKVSIERKGVNVFEAAAIGATDGAILRQFVAESAFIGLIGGLIGLGFGAMMVAAANAAGAASATGGYCDPSRERRGPVITYSLAGAGLPGQLRGATCWSGFRRRRRAGQGARHEAARLNPVDGLTEVIRLPHHAQPGDLRLPARHELQRQGECGGLRPERTEGRLRLALRVELAVEAAPVGVEGQRGPGPGVVPTILPVPTTITLTTILTMISIPVS